MLLKKMEDFIRTLTANLVYLKRPPESKDRRKREVESMIAPYEVTTTNIGEAEEGRWRIEGGERE